MFLKLRAWLIDWLAKGDLVVIINTATYDSVIEANSKLFPQHCLFKRNKVVNFDSVMEAEVAQRLGYIKQGVRKCGNALVLDPNFHRQGE